MTAVVAIMNKSGLALAADSAVTVTNGEEGYSSSKIYNTANKLFMLSKYHPVGIMVYSSAEFMHVPWELIIKLYRRNLNDKSFNTIEEYKDDFLEFLLKSSKFSFLKREKSYLFIVIARITSNFLNFANNLLMEDKEFGEGLELLSGDNLNNAYIGKLEDILKDLNSLHSSDSKKLADFLEYDFDDFCDKYSELVFKALQQCNQDTNIELNNYDSFKHQLVIFVYNYLTSNNFELGSTGIVFAGFGESEIYPALHSIEIDCMLNGKIRYKDTQTNKICENNSASIVPFAQKDVMQMFIEGIDPNIEQVFKNTFSKIMKGYNEILINNIDDNKLKQTIQSIDFDQFNIIFDQEIYSAKQVWQIAPTVNTIDILSKEDLAEMAESLIYLTFLKRRTSSSQESVGGPIDVAIISKGDGFIWKNRKHYFEKDLNQHYFSNYFNH